VPGTTTAPDPRATALSDDPELGHS
jgi:hypothetical protein